MLLLAWAPPLHACGGWRTECEGEEFEMGGGAVDVDPCSWMLCKIDRWGGKMERWVDQWCGQTAY